MTDAYIPVAANSTNLMELFNNSYYTTAPLSSEHVLFMCPIVAAVLVLIIMVVLVVLYVMPCGEVCGLKTRGKTGIKNQHKATIVAVSIISFIRIAIFIVYDIFALHLRHPCSHQKVAAVCEFSQHIYDTPRVLLISDSVAGSLSVLFIIAVVIQILANMIYQSDVEKISFRDLKYFLLVGIALLFVFSCLMHTPYITMAYLSDAHYATSILVYYMTILFVEFGMIQFVLRNCYDSRAPLILTEKNCKLRCLYTVTIVLVIFLILLLYGVVVCVSLFYYYLPVNNAISDLPNEGLVVYQTAIILLGAYITYKALIRVQKKNKYAHTISRKVKENEIALLSSEIEYLTLEASEIENRRKRILLLRKEIQLEYIQSNMLCLVDEPDSLINRRKVAHLYHQWKKIFSELEEELDNLRGWIHIPYHPQLISDYKTELNCLQNEFLHHLSQLHRLTEEQRSIDIKKDLNDEFLDLKKAIILTNDDSSPSEHEDNDNSSQSSTEDSGSAAVTDSESNLSDANNNTTGSSTENLESGSSTETVSITLDPDLPTEHPVPSATVNPISETDTKRKSDSSDPPNPTSVTITPEGDTNHDKSTADDTDKPGQEVRPIIKESPDAKQRIRKTKKTGYTTKSDLDNDHEPLISQSDGGLVYLELQKFN